MAHAAEESPFDCNICLCIPEAQVHQCVQGHLFCADCLRAHQASDQERANACPVCRTTLAEPIRSRIAESSIGELPSACPHCNTGMLRKQIADHVMVCEARTMPCSAASAGCAWQGRVGDQHAHEAACPFVVCRRMMAPLHARCDGLQSRCNQLESECQRLRAQNQQLQEWVATDGDCTLVRLATDKDITAEIGQERFFDLVTLEKIPTLRIKKELTVLHLKQDIWRMTGARPSQQRLWLWAKRQNHTYRLDRPLQLDYDDGVPMMDVDETLVGQSRTQVAAFLYLEVVGERGPVPEDPEETPPEDEGYPQLPTNQILLFLKFYEPAGEALSFVGTHIASHTDTLTDLLPVLRAARGLPPVQELAVYEELEFEREVKVEPLSDSKTLEEMELQSGDIIVYQKLPLPNIVAPNAGADRAPLLEIPAFLEHMKPRVDI